MGSLQAGFEVTRLPKDTNMSTPMFSDKKNNNDTTSVIRVGTGNRIFQIAESICSDPLTMFSLTNITYVLATSFIAYNVLHSPLTVSPSVHHRPVMALIGSMMVGTFAAYPLWPKPEPKFNNNRDNRGDTSGAAGVTNSKSL